MIAFLVYEYGSDDFYVPPHIFLQGNVVGRGVIELCDNAPPVRIFTKLPTSCRSHICSDKFDVFHMTILISFSLRFSTIVKTYFMYKCAKYLVFLLDI